MRQIALSYNYATRQSPFNPCRAPATCDGRAAQLWSSWTLPITVDLGSQKEGSPMNRVSQISSSSPTHLLIVKLPAYLLWSVGSLPKQTLVDSGTDISYNKRLLSGSLGWDSLWRKLFWPKDVSTVDSKLLPCILHQAAPIYTPCNLFLQFLVRPVHHSPAVGCILLKIHQRLQQSRSTFFPNLTQHHILSFRFLKLRQCLSSSSQSIFILIKIDRQYFI